MRILIVTTRRRLGRRFIGVVRERSRLPADTVFDLLTVFPTDAPSGFDRVFCAQPSLAPYRPVVQVSGPVREPLRGVRRLYGRALTAGRVAWSRVPLPHSARSNAQRYLASACATSPELHRLVAEMDAVVGMDDSTCWGLWELGRRVPGVPIVHQLRPLHRVLELEGHDLPVEAPRNVRSAEMVQLPGDLGLPTEPTASRRLLIAPANYAGQGHAWAHAVERFVDDATAMNFRAGTLKNPFLSDYAVDGHVFAGNLDWRVAWREFVRETFTHVIVEANRPIFGASASRGDQNVRELLHDGKTVALLTHGTDSRIPSVHAERERWHPYAAIDAAQLARMEANARANVASYNRFDGPVFASTPGLLEFLDAGTWLPLVVDPEVWASSKPLMQGLPIVAHIPSGPQKGSHMIDPILTRLQEQRVIEYRRVEGVQHAEMPALYGTADIMVEQFGIADYSVAACEAMAAGRVVVSRVADRVRERVLAETGLKLPIVEANPETLADVIVDLVRDPERMRRLGADGVEFVRAVHDGRRSATVLAQWLDGPRAKGRIAPDQIQVSQP